MIVECENNGTASTYGQCVCTPLWTGIYCNLPVCVNGGTLDRSVCNCAPGFYGVRCEIGLYIYSIRLWYFYHIYRQLCAIINYPHNVNNYRHRNNANNGDNSDSNLNYDYIKQ